MRLTATTGSELDIPGKQFVDALGRVNGYANDEGAEIRLGIEDIELGSFNDGVHDGGTFAASVGAVEGSVPVAKGQGPDGTLGGIVADVETSVGAILPPHPSWKRKLPLPPTRVLSIGSRPKAPRPVFLAAPPPHSPAAFEAACLVVRQPFPSGQMQSPPPGLFFPRHAPRIADTGWCLAAARAAPVRRQGLSPFHVSSPRHQAAFTHATVQPEPPAATG